MTEHIEGQMKEIRTITIRDVIRDVRNVWNKQYGHYSEFDMIGHPGKKAVGAIRRDLDALDLQSCGIADVDAAIGTTGWAGLPCDICKIDQELVVRLGDEPDYEARWLDVCRSCLDKALSLASQSRTPESDAQSLETREVQS